jgi:hypothetical protein
LIGTGFDSFSQFRYELFSVGEAVDRDGQILDKFPILIAPTDFFEFDDLLNNQ